VTNIWCSYNVDMFGKLTAVHS